MVVVEVVFIYDDDRTNFHTNKLRPSCHSFFTAAMSRDTLVDIFNVIWFDHIVKQDWKGLMFPRMN